MTQQIPIYLASACQNEAHEQLIQGGDLNDDHLLALAQMLAVHFYKMQSYQVAHNFDFLNSKHPMEQRMFDFGLHAVGFMRNCDISDLAEEYRHEEV